MNDNNYYVPVDAHPGCNDLLNGSMTIHNFTPALALSNPTGVMSIDSWEKFIEVVTSQKPLRHVFVVYFGEVS